MNTPLGNQNQIEQGAQATIIKRPFSENEARAIIEKFNKADSIQKEINAMLKNKNAELPVPVFILSNPDFVFTGWLQGIGVFNNDVCAILTYKSTHEGPLFLSPYSSILFMRTRDRYIGKYGLPGAHDTFEELTFVDNMLKIFEANKI